MSTPVTTDIEFDPLLVADSRETAAALAASAGRKTSATPIRRLFVQPTDRDNQPQGGPLAELVRRRDRRALVLYLMIVTLASAEPWNVCRDARFWARLLDLPTDAKGRAAVSKALRRLRDLNLIAVTRRGRKADIQLLLEDGSGAPYTYPDPKLAGGRYLKLPHAFWTEGWFQTLNTPGLAMLLVLLAEKDGVVLPIDRIPNWYGISRKTAQRGFSELKEHGLVAVWVTQRKAPLAPDGYTFDRHHRLLGDFARPATTTAIPEADDQPTPVAQDPKNDGTSPSGSQRRRARRRKSTTKRKEETK